jgi:hypothetical protein
MASPEAASARADAAATKTVAKKRAKAEAAAAKLAKNIAKAPARAQAAAATAEKRAATLRLNGRRGRYATFASANYDSVRHLPNLERMAAIMRLWMASPEAASARADAAATKTVAKKRAKAEAAAAKVAKNIAEASARAAAVVRQKRRAEPARQKRRAKLRAARLLALRSEQYAREKVAVRRWVSRRAATADARRLARAEEEARAVIDAAAAENRPAPTVMATKPVHATKTHTAAPPAPAQRDAAVSPAMLFLMQPKGKFVGGAARGGGRAARRRAVAAAYRSLSTTAKAELHRCCRLE